MTELRTERLNKLTAISRPLWRPTEENRRDWLYPVIEHFEEQYGGHARLSLPPALGIELYNTNHLRHLPLLADAAIDDIKESLPSQTKKPLPWLYPLAIEYRGNSSQGILLMHLKPTDRIPSDRKRIATAFQATGLPLAVAPVEPGIIFAGLTIEPGHPTLGQELADRLTKKFLPAYVKVEPVRLDSTKVASAEATSE